MTNETHIANFVAGINAAMTKCELIMQHLDDHCEVAPDDVNAGHVGNVWHVVAQLNDIQTFLGIKEE